MAISAAIYLQFSIWNNSFVFILHISTANRIKLTAIIGLRRRRLVFCIKMSEYCRVPINEPLPTRCDGRKNKWCL